MDQALVLSALLMGLAGTPHCLAMCGAACTAATGGGRRSSLWSFHLGRGLAYAVAGAVVAASVGGLAAMGQAVAALRPLWTLLHLAALTLGLFLLWKGRQPGWMERLGRARGDTTGAAPGPRWQRIQGPARSAGLGLAWVAWPCGLLQSALLVASLASGAWQGAAVMAGFAAASSGGLVLGPALWWRLRTAGGADRRSRPGAAGVPGAAAMVGPAVRLAGLALALASTWALGHGLWLRLVAWCFP